MGCGELLQDCLADLNLMTDGAMLFVALMVSFSGDKKEREDQSKDQHCCTAYGSKTNSFRHDLSPFCVMLRPMTVLANAVQDGIKNIQFKAVQFRHDARHSLGVFSIHMKGFSASCAGHVQVGAAVRRTYILIVHFPAAWSGKFTEEACRFQPGKVSIDCTKADLLHAQRLGNLADRQPLIRMLFQKGDQPRSLPGLIVSCHNSSHPNLRIIRKLI